MYRLRLSKISAFLLTVVTLIIFIAQLPVIHEFFYWYSAATVYELTFIFFIFYLIFIVQFSLTGKLKFYPLMILVVLINGSSELLIGITNFLLLLVMASSLLRQKKELLKVVVLNLVGWISTLCMILSPGTVARRSVYDYGGNFIGSIKVALLYGTKFIFITITEIYIVLFILFLFLFLFHGTKKNSTNIDQYINPVILGIISYVAILSMVFILYYATGNFTSTHLGRGGNLLKLTFMLFLILNVINFQQYIKGKIPDSFKKDAFYAGALVILVILIPFSDTNYNKFLADLRERNLDRFQNEFYSRTESIKRQKGHILELKKIEGMELLSSGDPSLSKQEWVQECYLNYINSKYHKRFQKIILSNSKSY